ncbi:hypothetical protein PHISP_05226 [Aspergillus sp. HF37]|nr:hypothetical protein PHISP_05226 [Aspergillus sp. HF37]
MKMRLSLLLAPVLAALAAADSTTTVGYFGADNVATGVRIPFYTSTAASVAGINAIATTYRVDCMKGAPKSDCQIATPWTIIEGPGTHSFTGAYTASSEGHYTSVTAVREMDCTFTSSSVSASCSFSYMASGTADGYAFTTSASGSTSKIPSDSVTHYALPVTAGISSFTAPQATRTPDAAAAPAKPVITACPLGAAAAVAIGAMF